MLGERRGGGMLGGCGGFGGGRGMIDLISSLLLNRKVVGLS